MLPDSMLDEVTLTPVDQAEGPFCHVQAAPEAQLVADLLSLQSWSFVRYFARCAEEGSGAAFDGAGWAYDTDEREPDEEPFTGVVVFMPWDEEVNVGRDAFDRLLARYLRCVEQAARGRDDPALAESWWPGFVATVDVLARRAGN